MKMQRLNLCSHGGFLAAVAITVLSAASARADYQSTVLADNPIAYYPLNLATDTKQNGGGQYLATDLSGNTNDGVYVNIYPGYNNVTGPSAYITNGVAFDYLEYVGLSTGSNTALLNFSNTITMEAWVQPVSSTLSDADIIAKGYDSNLGYDEVTLRANGGSYYGGTYGPAGGKGVAGGTQTTDWTYVVCTYNGTNWNMYVNGELKATSPDTVGALDFPDPWAIGNGTADAANVRYFQGNISQVALYTNALTPGQVLTHYFVGKSGTTNPPPIITADPASATRYVGSYVTFAVSALSATPMSYQWNRGTSPAVPLDGETNATLKLSNLQPGDAGDYSVTITNTGGSSTSAAAVLTVLSGPAPGPTVQHFWHVGEDDNVLPADSAGANPFEYGFGTRTVVTNTHAPGSTASLNFGGDGGDWMNDVISVPDDAWVIEMWVRPTTVANPVSLLTLGDQNGAAQFAIEGGQWSFNEFNDNIGDSSQTAVANQWTELAWVRDDGTNRFFVNGVQVGSDTAMLVNNGRMHLSVRPGIGDRSLEGNVDEIRFSTFEPGLFDTSYLLYNIYTNDPPVIDTDPVSATRYVGGHYTFTVGVQGTAPLKYQWYKGISALTGKTNTTLTLTNLQMGDAGDYSVTVTNVAGSDTSAAATLTVLAGPPPPPTVQHFWHLGEDANLLPTDSVGTNYFEYGYGTRTVDTNYFAPGSAASLHFAGDVDGGWGGDWMNNVIAVPADNWLIELWVRPENTSLASLFTLGGQTGAAQLGIENGNWAFVEFNQAYGDNSQPVVTNQWTHLAWVRDEGVNRFFVNGVQVGSDNAVLVNSGQLFLSTYPGVGNRELQGNIDEVQFATFAAGAFTPKDLSYYTVPPGPLAFGASGGSLTISWPGGAGLLQRSTNVAGPYTDVNGASSPYIISTTNAAEFFRLKQ